MTDDKVIIGGKAKLRNVIKGNTSLRNVLNGSPGVTLGGGMPPAVKEALLDCFEHVAWVDDDGQVYYQALYDALYPKVLASITAVFNQGQNVIYDTDTLDDLTQYLTVTATYDDSSTATIASTDYTLSGTLTPGTSTITVTYKSKTATFNVTVTHMPGTVTITNTLTGCTTSNAAASGTEGASYSATITASSGYSLTGASVSITMGGVDITASAYTNGTISIAELTGNLVITIAAVVVTLSSISAVYTQSGTVYDIDSLDNLKADLVVTALYSDTSSETVPSTDYTLSGTLTAGTSTITVTYEGKATTFNVTVTTAILYQLANEVFANDHAIDTNLNLLGSGDRDFSIMVDVDSAGQTSGRYWNLVNHGYSASPYYSVAIMAHTTQGNGLRIQWMTDTSGSPSSPSYSWTGNLKIVYTHVAGSGVMKFAYKYANGSVVTGTRTGAYFAPTGTGYYGTLKIARDNHFNGTVNSIKILSVAITDQQMNDFVSQ